MEDLPLARPQSLLYFAKLYTGKQREGMRPGIRIIKTANVWQPPHGLCTSTQRRQRTRSKTRAGTNSSLTSPLHRSQEPDTAGMCPPHRPAFHLEIGENDFFFLFIVLIS
uniref:Uncharacterized protein n=1 Tax=Salarias fasciatus TaxID=181472 RepID=A0A672G008_SALFA